MIEFIGIWAIVVGIIGLNGFAAGIVGILHAWRSKKRRGGRVLTAAAVTGFLPTSMMIPAMLPEVAVGGEAPIYMVLGAGMIFAIATVVSLPAAIIVARKLEQPGDEFRAFE